MTPLPAWAAATIGTAQIKNGAVTTAKLHGGAVTSPKIKAGAVNGGKIAANAVTGAKIKDGTIEKADLAAAAQGFTTIVTKTSSQASVASGASHEQTVVCDAGQVAIGGGGYATPDGLVLFGTTAGEVTKSHPTTPISFGGLTFSGAAGNGVAPTGWRTTVKNTEPTAQTVVHYAMCASK